VAFLRAARPDLQFIPIRGNIDTRVAKLLREDSEFDAIVLAAAGLERLGLADLRRTFLDTSILLPAPGQGALVIEGRRDDPRAREIAAVVNDPATWPAVMAERALVQALDAGCRLPVGALATVLDSGLNIEAAVASLDASTVIRDGCSGRVDDAAAVGAELGRRLRERGAAALVASPGGRQ
jgi:hydroxymethylbilane synthase